MFPHGIGFERSLLEQCAAKQVPISAALELLPLCNLKCKMCYARLSAEEMARIGRLRTAQEWLSLAKEMKDEGVLFVLLTGGEPLLYQPFREVYLGLQRMGMLVTINTNGTLLDEQWADFFAQNPPRSIHVTLYGADAQTYGSLCGRPDCFEKTIHAMKLLKERNVSVRVNINAVKTNAASLQEMLEICKELDTLATVDTYMLPSKQEQGLPVEQQARLSPVRAAQAQRLVRMTRLEPQSYRQMITNMLYQTQEEANHSREMRCHAGRCTLAVSWQGKLQPCVVLSAPSADVFQDGFASAWKRIVQQKKKILLSEKCAKCRLLPLCRVCPAASLLEEGSFDAAPRYLCEYTRESVALMLDIRLWRISV